MSDKDLKKIYPLTESRDSAGIKASFDGEEYVLRFGGRETRVSRSSVLGECVEAAATLSGLDGDAVEAWKMHPDNDAEKWEVQPKDVVATIQGLRSSLEEVTSFSRGGYRAEETAVEVGETFTYTGDRPFVGRVQVTALGRPFSRYLKLKFSCGNDDDKCDGCPLNGNVTLKFTSGEMDPSAFSTYFDTDNPKDALRVLAERSLKPLCMKWLKSARIEGNEEKAVTPAVVIDRQGTEGQAWFVHGPRCDLKRAPNWITAMGWLCHGKKGRIGVLVEEFTTESEVAVPTDEELTDACSTLQRHVDTESNDLKDSAIWRIAEALKRRSQLKGEEIVKGYASDLLTVSSSTWVKTPEGEPQLGATTNELGPTTTAKSQRVRELIAWLGAGRYHAGRMTEAGLTAGAEQIKDLGWILRKGLLPSMDLSLIILDNMPPRNLDRQIESRRNGIVQLASMKSAELWARCRLKLLGNPKQPFDETLHRCVALKVYDSKLIARFAFAVFTYGVSVEERYDPELQTPLDGDEELLEAARTVIRWNLSKERTYTTSPEHWLLIMKLGRRLEEKFGCEDIPLLLRSTPYKLAVVAYPFALLEGYEAPEKRHIQLAYEWLCFCAEDIELDSYVVEWRRSHELGEEEYTKISEKLQEQFLDEVKIHGGTEEETETYRIIEYVAKNASATRDAVAGYISMVPKTVTEKVQLLKGLGILRSDKNGYHFTAKGVRFLRRWMPERTQVTDVTDVTGPVRTKELTPAPDEVEPLLSRTGGNMSNIGNLKKLVPGGEPSQAYGTHAPSDGAGVEVGTEEESPEADEDKLLDDIAEFFTKMDSSQVDQNKLYAHIKEKHRLTQDEFTAILKGWPELFELDGWTVTIKEIENQSQERRNVENVEKSNLQTQLEKVLNVIGEMERISGSVRDDDLYDALQSDHGIGRAEGVRLIGVLMKDGTIYSPRPGYYKRAT